MKYIKFSLSIVLCTLLNFSVNSQCTFTMSHTKVQPTCGANGQIVINTTNLLQDDGYIVIYRDGAITAILDDRKQGNFNDLQPGTYKIVITNKATGCKDSIDNIVLDPAASSFSATYLLDSVKCTDSADGRLTLELQNAKLPVTYKWSHSTAEKDSIAENLTEGKYRCTLTDNSNCRFELDGDKEMEVFAKKRKLRILDTIIVNSSCNEPTGHITINASNGDSTYFQWQNQDSLNTITMPLDSLGKGKYTCIFMDTSGCPPIEVKDIEIVQNPNPKGRIEGTDTICDNGNTGKLKVILTEGDTSLVSYQWSDGSIVDSIDNLSSGVYRVTITDQAGCIDTPKFTIYDYPIRTISITADPETTVPEGRVNMKIDSPGGLYSIEWTPEQNFDGHIDNTSTDNKTISVVLKETSRFIVNVKYGPNCKITAVKTVRVVPEIDSLGKLPNMFSPNGDGRNETYKIDSKKLVGTESFEIQIFDRWGNAVYKSNDVKFEWDGISSNGEPLMSGVYTYFIKYNLTSDRFTDKIKKGIILLER